MNLIGKTLGQYQIVEQIGHGGMATVFKAYQLALNRHVAVKALHAQQGLAPGFYERFEREVRTVAQLNHPNILPIIDFGRQDGLSYIVMKLVSGGTLRERLGRPLSLDETARFVEQVSAALDHAHGKGVLHRDVKPSNVLLDEDDWVQLADFGLAKLVVGGANLTASGACIGTPTYMSPEQAQGLELDQRTDVYALGVMLYEMLTGQAPFQAATSLAVMLKHVSADTPSHRDTNPALSQAVVDVTLKSLEKQPDRRYTSAGELARALQRAITGQADTLPVFEPPHRPSVPLGEPPSAFSPASTASLSTEDLGRKQLSQLRRVLDDHFDEEELRTLCFDLGVNYADLPAQGRKGKVRELLALLKRHDRISELLEWGKQSRPDIAWDFAPAPGANGVAPRKAELTPPKPTRPPLLVDFVGREAELAYYANKLTARRPAVITGIAGVGKTALALALIQQAAAPDQVFWHAFHEGEGVDALLWKLAGFLAWRGQDDVWRMLQGARESGGQPPLTSVLLDYLFQTLRGRDYLLCLDDFQFVDDDPLLNQLAERMCGTVEAGELLLIITSRRLPHFARATEYEALSGLSAADSARLLAARDAQLPQDLSAKLYTHTEGNAALLTLALDALKKVSEPERLIASLAETDDIERYLVYEVDEGLSEKERQVMSAVALLGRPGTRDAIETVLDGGSVRRALGDLSRRHLLTRSQSEWGSEYGQHAILRAFYYDMLGRRELRDMHRRAGEFYESEEPDTLKAARHYERAGEYERAAQLATGDVWALINQGQAQALRRLLERFKAGQLDAELWAAVNIARGEICTLQRENQLAQDSYQEALAGLDALPDAPQARELYARACRGMGDLLRDQSPAEALEWLRRGLDKLAGANPQEQAALYLKMSTAQMYMGDFEAALSAVQKGQSLLPQGPHWLSVGVLVNQGMICANQGDPQRASEVFVRALGMSQQLNDHFRTFAILNNLGICNMMTNDWQAAIDAYRQGLVLAERLGSILGQVSLSMNLGLIRARQGDYASALQCFSHGFHLAHSNKLGRYEISGHLGLADLHLRQGEVKAAALLLDEAERLALKIKAKGKLSDVYAGQARVYLAQEEAGTARDYAERAVNLACELGMDFEQGVGLRVLGQALLANGQREQALAAFEDSLSVLAELDPYEAARTQAQWGLALLSGDNAEQGTVLLGRARVAFHTLGARRDEAAVQASLAERRG